MPASAVQIGKLGWRWLRLRSPHYQYIIIPKNVRPCVIRMDLHGAMVAARARRACNTDSECALTNACMTKGFCTYRLEEICSRLVRAHEDDGKDGTCFFACFSNHPAQLQKPSLLPRANSRTLPGPSPAGKIAKKKKKKKKKLIIEIVRPNEAQCLLVR